MPRTLVGIGAAAAVAVVLAGCGLPDGDYFGKVPDVHGRTGYLRFCNQGEPDSLDPAMATTTTALPIVYSMFDGLALYDKDGMPAPSLATSWDVSPDMRTFTFHLRKDGRFSNGRPIDAYDFAYEFIRLLHPVMASPNADGLLFVKNYDLYTGNRVRKLLSPAGPLAAGTPVELVGAAGKAIDAWTKEGKDPPDTNLRRSTKAVGLRDLGAAAKDAYATVPAGADLTVIELSGGPVSYPSPDGKPWAYVFWDQGNGHFGWVPYADLDVAPNDDVDYEVEAEPMRQVPGLEADAEVLAADDKAPRATFHVKGRDLLMLPELLGMRVPDRYTFVVETPTPTPYVIASISSRPFRPTPREVVSRWPKRWTDPDKIVDSGPMHLTEWKERDYVELVRSKTFWNPSIVKLDEITFFSMDDQAANTNYYAAGGCDAMASNNIPSSYLPVMNGERRRYKDFRNDPYNGIYFAYIQTKKVTNRHLRRALAFAIDRRPIPGLVHGGQIPTAQLTPGKPIKDMTDDELRLCGVTRDHPGVAMIEVTGKVCYVPPPGLDFDPEAAKRELAEARKEMGAKFPDHLTYRYNAGSEGHKIIAEYLQAQWKKVLGFDVELESQEWKTFVVDTRDGNYELARFGNIGSIPDTESEFLVLFQCNSPNNRAKYCTPEYEAAMNAAFKLTDRQARNAKLAEAEKIMINDAPVIPLYVYTQQHLIKPYVKGMGINLVDQVPVYEAWIDPDWRAHQAEAAH